MLQKFTKKIFLIDGLGACTSAFALGFLLPTFSDFFEVEIEFTRPLFYAALALALYSLTCFFLQPTHWRKLLFLVAILNLSYCTFSIFWMVSHWGSIGFWGIVYLIQEKAIVIPLAIGEIWISRN